MKNNSSQNRFARITAKVIVILLAVVMSLSVLPTLSADILPSASAASELYSIPANANLTDVNNKLASYPAGSVVDVTMLGDVVITVSGDTHSSGFTGIIVPANITVNLFMNGKSIKLDRPSGGAWQLPYVYGIHNKGTLNIYSGANASGTNTAAAISLVNVRTGMSPDSKREISFCALEAVHNEGTLSINKGVNITVTSQLHYDKVNTGGSLTNQDSAQVASGATGVYNTSSAASCVLKGVTMNVYAMAEGTFSSNSNGGGYTDSVAVAYGVYGGDVTLQSDSKVTVTSQGNHSRDTYMGSASDGKSYITSVAYGVASNGTVNITGATITHDANINNSDAVKSDGNGRQYLYSGGVFTLAGKSPVMPDATITTPNEDCMNTGDGAVTYRKGAVATCSEMINNATAIVDYMRSFRDHHVQVPVSNVSAGTFIDEAHNGYSTNMATSVNAIPTGITRGATDGTNRVHIIYRYWVDQNRSAIDTSIVGTEGNVGFSYSPLTDGTNVVKSLVTLKGVTSQTNLTKNPDAAIQYLSGADSNNSYYWKLIDVAYAQPSAAFSDYVVTSTANRGTVFQNLAAQNANQGSAPAANGPIYIFVDYARIEPSSIKVKVGTSNIATTTYTGYPIKATDIGLKILDSIYETDFTSEYNVDFDNSELIPVKFSYVGTNTAGVDESNSSGQLPTNAGTYEVTLHITESITYDKNPKINKNRYGLEHKFTLVIDQAPVLRGTLPESVTLTYGQKLSEVILLSTYDGKGIANDGNIAGTFEFTNNSDATAFKNVGENVVSITWKPKYEGTVNTKNYKETTFNVGYTVNKAKLSIRPNAAAVVYGNETFDTPYSVTINGLVANDNTDTVKKTITNALNFMILKGTEYNPYVAGEVAVGSYSIRATFTDVPALLSNYEYELIYGLEGNPEGNLKVSQRAISVIAKATNREYAPDDYTVTVTFTISDGKFGVDDVRILAAAGGLSDNNAGTREVSGITKQAVADLVTGGAGKNYYVADVKYETGNTLLVEISKCVPVATTPVIAEMFYQRGRTLKDIELSGSTTSVEGSWQWVDATVNPTVAVSSYKAQFVPTDTRNYEIKVVDVSVKVKATPVVISYTGNVSYGDNIPNITAYTYKSDLDPTFNIEAVITSGNITPYTTYEKGSPVVEGGYPVEISAPNFVDTNGNYIFSTENGVINVSPRLITFNVQNTSVVYGENFAPSASNVTVTFDESLLVGTDTIEDITANGNEPTFEYSTDFRYIDNYQVGTYTIKATPNFTTSANYSVTSVPGTLTVTKASLVIKADDITLEYGSPIPENISSAFEVVGAKRNETVEDVVSSGYIKVDTVYEKGSPVNTDGYPITVDVANAVFNNYIVNVQHGTVTVVKATPKVITLPTATIVHGQTLADAKFTGGEVENNITGKYIYNAAATAPAYRADAYTIYTATFVPADTVNYNTVTGLYVSLTVTKKPVTGALSVAGIPMVGETLTVDVSGLDPDELGVYTLTWYNGSGAVIGTGDQLKLTDAHKLQELKVTAVANAPYTGEIVCVTTTIAPSLTSVETVLGKDVYDTYFDLAGLSEYLGEASYVYNAQPHYIEFQRDNSSLSSVAIGDVTVKYNGSTAAPTKVGYYTVTIDIATPSDVDLTQVQFVDGVSMVGNKVVYSPISNYKIGTLVITPAPYYVNLVVLDKVYDGTGTATAEIKEQYGACELTGGGYDDVSFDEEAAVYYFSNPTVGADKDVFVNNAQLKGAAADNYEIQLAVLNDAKADITKRTLKVKVIPVEREYEEKNYYVDLSFEPVANTVAEGDDGLVYVNEALVQGAIDNYRAGLRNVTVSGAVLTGSKAANYDLELVNLDGLTVQILKATPSYPIPMTDVLYYDSARPLNAISLGDSRWSWDASVRNDVPGAGVHTYKAVYTPDDTLNFATVEYDVELEILKTTVTITAANFTVTYGDIEPTYYYSVTGLTGADTIKNSVDGYVLMNCSYKAGSDVGVYDVVLTGAFESDNYSFVYKNGKVTVNKRAAYVEAIAEDRQYEPGNLNVNVTFSALTNLYGTDSTSLFLEGTFPLIGTIEDENAGIKNVKYTVPVLAGEKAKNYDLRLLNPSLTVEIQKAVLSGVVLPKSGEVFFGQKLNMTVFTSSFEGHDYGTFSMENPTGTPEKVGTFSDVYKVVFTPYKTQNYATITQYITLTVKPATLNVAISLTGTAQVGKTLYVITNDIPANAHQYLFYEWYRVDSPDADPRTGYKLTSGVDYYTLTEADGGKYIMCTVTNISGSPYECEAKCITDSTIEEETLTFWQRLVNWFYRLISNITQIFGKLM